MYLISAFAFHRRCDWTRWNRVIEIGLTILTDVALSVKFSHAQVFDLNACFFSFQRIQIFCFNNWAYVRLYEWSNILFQQLGVCAHIYKPHRSFALLVMLKCAFDYRFLFEKSSQYSFYAVTMKYNLFGCFSTILVANLIFVLCNSNWRLFTLCE